MLKNSFFNIQEIKWSKIILAELNIGTNLFAKPAPSGLEIGEVRKSIAKNLNFKGDVSIVTGVHNQAGDALVVGSIEGEIAMDGMVTVECITSVLSKIIINKNMLQNNFCTQFHGVADKYVTLAYNLSSGSILKWYRDTLAIQEK